MFGGPIRVAMLAHTCYLTDPRVRREAETLAELGVKIHVVALSENGTGISGTPRQRSQRCACA